MAQQNQPRPLVIAGPSGSGKSTLLKRLFADYPDAFGFSVSHTTRKPRPGEVNGKDYFFTDVDTFVKEVNEGKFVESAVYGGNHYGTSKAAIKAVAENHKICILDIDRRGVQSIKKTDMNANYLFIRPPSVEVLEERLRKRGTETEESLKKRMEEMKGEMEYASQPGAYDVVIVNDDLERTYDEFKRYVEKQYPLILKK
ncbi:hypothetical protein MP638_003886 [Amoeboaphelidium occidentale]|nr:hypothetical protein MP638_003886 [Amoeboaphelidium occidentale]